MKNDAVIYAPLELILITFALSLLGGVAGWLSRVDKKQAAKTVFTVVSYVVIAEAVGMLVMYIALWRDEIPDSGIPAYVLACSLSGIDLLAGVRGLVVKQIERFLMKGSRK